MTCAHVWVLLPPAKYAREVKQMTKSGYERWQCAVCWIEVDRLK